MVESNTADCGWVNWWEGVSTTEAQMIWSKSGLLDNQKVNFHLFLKNQSHSQAGLTGAFRFCAKGEVEGWLSFQSVEKVCWPPWVVCHLSYGRILPLGLPMPNLPSHIPKDYLAHAPYSSAISNALTGHFKLGNENHAMASPWNHSRRKLCRWR